MKRIGLILFVFLFYSCGAGNFYFIDNSTSQNHLIKIHYAESSEKFDEIYKPTDSLLVSDREDFSKKPHRWTKNNTYKIPYERIDDLTYKLDLKKGEKVMIPYRYRLFNSVVKVEFDNKEKVIINDSIDNYNFYSEKLKSNLNVNYSYKTIGDSYYLIKIKDTLNSIK